MKLHNHFTEWFLKKGIGKYLEKKIKKQIFHKYLDIILEPIQLFLEKRTNLLLNNKFIWFYPKILTIITNWPKAATFCLTYKLTKSKYSCYFCLVKRNNLTNTNLIKKDIKLRNYKKPFVITQRAFLFIPYSFYFTILSFNIFIL